MSDKGFFESVYAIVRQIPPGRVTSYGAIAKAIGSPRGARVVGYAMNASHGDSSIPAHRVVNSKGLLTGKFHFQGINLMQKLLEKEGIRIENNQVQDFQKHFWDPLKSLGKD